MCTDPSGFCVVYVVAHSNLQGFILMFSLPTMNM